MKKNFLPAYFNPYRCDDLVRLGKDFDGGYLVSRKDIRSATILISMGISDDWSFEEDFNKLNDCELYAYDGSINTKFFLVRLIKAIARIDNPRILVERAKTFLSYRRFFRNNRKHIEKFVAIHAGLHSVGFDDIQEKVREKSAFFKIDIEGGEYQILRSLVEASKHITGLVIEFHSCTQHLEEIKNFIRDCGLYLIHVHANNFVPVNENALPQVLELTFSASAGDPIENAVFPHALDMPNNPTTEEIEIAIRSSNEVQGINRVAYDISSKPPSTIE